MKKFARAGGLAAAVLALAVTVGSTDPLEASRAQAVQGTPSYLEHAGATNGEALEGDVGALADSFIQAAEAVVPRARSLDETVEAYAGTEVADAEQDCLASAVYFEARGEPIEGQLAVADVVMNRVASKKYPDTICEVVTQPWQFSFVQDGIIPEADRTSESWRKAVAISEIVLKNIDTNIKKDVLWYHADYVSPSWGKRLTRQEKIGLHIFYS
jgi:spore germination cell wall hydrolase CwlJ-like protein